MHSTWLGGPANQHPGRPCCIQIAAAKTPGAHSVVACARHAQIWTGPGMETQCHTRTVAFVPMPVALRRSIPLAAKSPRDDRASMFEQEPRHEIRDRLHDETRDPKPQR